MADNKEYTKEDLFDLIRDVMGIETITPMIIKQVNRFVLLENMTFKDIARCIVWYTEEAGGILQPMYGLGIIPNIKEQAMKYFKQLELDQQKQLEQAQKIVEYQDNNIIFNIGSLKHKKREPRQFNIEDIKFEGDES